MKDAFICPMWNCGDRAIPSNYRPIALTKMLKGIVWKRLVPYLEDGNLMDPNQHSKPAALSIRSDSEDTGESRLGLP